MEAIILAGGLGTRLKSVISDIPKPMAPVAERPFLEYIFKYLNRYRIDKVVLAVGYKWEIIHEYFGEKYNDIDIYYSIENEPLGTGGAIKKAFEIVESKNVFIINGDTFFDIDLEKLYKSHLEMNSDLTLSLKPMKQFNRYGSVVVESNRVVRFEEKRYKELGNINCGVYIANSKLFDEFSLPQKFSFETDLMEKNLCNFNINAIIEDKYFIDIGIPEEYSRAQEELSAII